MTKKASQSPKKMVLSAKFLTPLSLTPARVKVIRVESENSLVSLLTLDMQMPHAQPGQFVMVWSPGQDEKPMSIAETKPSLQLAIAKAGPCSKKLAESKPGEFLWVRGPLGKPFWPVGKKWLLIGGGYGFAPLRFLARVGMENGAQVETICGARTKDLLMKPLAGIGKSHITTDDGSAGVKGNVLVALEPLLADKKSKFDCVYSCGPENMMKGVAQLCKAHGVKSQLSVERYMKCGFGVCGHCAMGGWLSCIDGPSIDGEEALANSEFGTVHVDRAGRKIKF